MRVIGYVNDFTTIIAHRCVNGFSYCYLGALSNSLHLTFLVMDHFSQVIVVSGVYYMSVTHFWYKFQYSDLSLCQNSNQRQSILISWTSFNLKSLIGIIWLAMINILKILYGLLVREYINVGSSYTFSHTCVINSVAEINIFIIHLDHS